MNIKSITVAIACLSLFSFAQLPTLTVKTKNNATPGTQSANGVCPAGTSSGGFGQNAGNSTSGLNLFILPYIEATEIEMSGITNSYMSGGSNYNFKITSSGIAGQSDSIRRRGNSTASGGGGGGFFGGGGGGEKIPFRIKFDKRQPMFDRPKEKSWALVANYYDPSLMQSNLAFYIGRKLGLDFTPHGYYVYLNVANQNRGVYLLTDQIQRSEASVNIDKEDGWLAEFDYHCATDNDDNRRYYHTGSNRYNINVKIREPDLDDLPLNSSRKPDATCLDFVKSDLNALLDKMKENNFPNNGYRDYIDLESYAKYIMIQLFLDNQDFNGLASSSTLLGSNYAYKNKGEKIKAGPLWDFDLACGSKAISGNTFFGYENEQLEPRHDFYKRLWSDPVFKFKYKKIWNDNKAVFENISKDNGVIDSITNLIASARCGNDDCIKGNVGNGVSNVTAQSYRTHAGNLKTWWRKRITSFNNFVNGQTVDSQTFGNVASSDVAESAVAPALLNSKRNCREAVSSSSKASNSSSSTNTNNASSSSRANSSSSSGGSSSGGSGTNSSSSVASSGNCAYQSSWCNNNPVATTPTAAGSSCFFVTNITKLQGSSIKINGVTPTANNGNSEFVCGQWSKGDCSSLLPAKQDGGYYVYTGSWVSLENSTFTNGSSNCGTTSIKPILVSQNNIVLENLPSNAKIEVYNLQGKHIYSAAYPENSKILRIGVQTKGMYIVQITFGSEKKIQRFVVK